MKKETQALIDEVVKNWDKIQMKFFVGKRENEYDELKTPIGEIYWDNLNLIWVLTTSNGEDYDGSQTQIGINKEGKLKWEYQSHCSCDGYETSHERGEDFPEMKQRYELNDIPQDWEEKITENIKKLLSDE